MNYKDFIPKFYEYQRLGSELEQAIAERGAVQAQAQADASARFDLLAVNIQRFCGSESFRSVIKNFCYLYADRLSVSGGHHAINYFFRVVNNGQ